MALRFPPSLEREYRDAHLTRVASRVRAWQAILLALGLLAAVYRLGVFGQFGLNLETLLRLGVLVPACAAMLLAAHSKQFQDRYLGVAFIGSMIVSAVSAILVATAIAEQRDTVLVFLTTYFFASFFLAGLLLWDAVLVSVVGVVSFAIAASYFGLPSDRLIYDFVLLVIVAAVGGFVAYSVEETNRRWFLERGVLGDLAERDGLTGLRNRRAFDEHLARVWQQSLRDRSALSILLIDLDHFKRYNDHYGHQAGDACLRHVAQIVQRFGRRPLDIAARYGGEELAIVLYQVTDDHAMAVAEQLRAAIESSRVEHMAAPPPQQLSVSVGVAWLQATLDRSPEDIVQLADQALYAAKLAGRNQVQFMKAEQPPGTGFSSALRRVPRVAGTSGPIGLVATNRPDDPAA